MRFVVWQDFELSGLLFVHYPLLGNIESVQNCSIEKEPRRSIVIHDLNKREILFLPGARLRSGSQRSPLRTPAIRHMMRYDSGSCGYVDGNVGAFAEDAIGHTGLIDLKIENRRLTLCNAEFLFSRWSYW